MSRRSSKVAPPAPQSTGMFGSNTFGINRISPSLHADGIEITTGDGQRLFVSTDPYNYTSMSSYDVQKLGLSDGMGQYLSKKMRRVENPSGPHTSSLTDRYHFFVLVAAPEPGVRHNAAFRYFVVARDTRGMSVFRR